MWPLAMFLGETNRISVCVCVLVISSVAFFYYFESAEWGVFPFFFYDFENMFLRCGFFVC